MERIRAEKALRASESRFRVLFERSPVATCLYEQRLVIHANPTYLRMFGCRNDEGFQSRPLLEFIAPRSREQMTGIIRCREMGLPAPTEYETTGLRKDGSEFPLGIISTRVDLADGPTTIGFFADLTECVRTQEPLLESENSRAVAGMAAGVAHEINSPPSGVVQDAQLRQYQQGLEEQVWQRTAELQAANQALAHKTIALREVLASIQAEKREAIQAITCQIEHTVLPLLQRLRDSATPACLAIINHVGECLREMTSSHVDRLARLAASLTPTELRICRLIRQDLSSKDIARAEGISRETVESHRRNIRRKLKINNERVNLTTYLQSLAELDAPSHPLPDRTR